MHCPHVFKEERLDVLHSLIKAHPLATLVTTGSQGLMANLIPFSLHDNGGNGVLRAHLARSNSQIISLREATEVLVIFQGPECYITPAWYPSKAEHGKVVPTWNFVMVQARGIPTVIEDSDWLREQLNALTVHLERKRESPWQVSDAPDHFISAQLKGIIGIEIPITTIEGKWKVSQNRSADDRQGVIEGLRVEDVGSGIRELMEEQFITE